MQSNVLMCQYSNQMKLGDHLKSSIDTEWIIDETVQCLLFGLSPVNPLKPCSNITFPVLLSDAFCKYSKL